MNGKEKEYFMWVLVKGWNSFISVCGLPEWIGYMLKPSVLSAIITILRETTGHRGVHNQL